MSDDTKKRDLNYDLERAQQKMIAAGYPDLADALYDYAQASRNYVQGDLGQSFVNSLAKYVVPLQENGATTERILGQVLQRLDQQRDLVQQILTAHKETARGLKKLQGQMRESQADRREIHKEVAEVKADLAVIQARLDRQDEIERRLLALERSDG